MNKKGWAVVSLLGILLLCGLFQVGWFVGRRALRVEAVQAGHARHVIVNEFGHTEFRWLEKGDK